LLNASSRNVVKPDVSSVSAEYMLGRLRRRERELLEPVGSKAYDAKGRPLRKKSAQSVGPQPGGQQAPKGHGRRKRRGGGGLYRA
jgi:hypothetical protein